ncbi:MAG: hypothetical protein GC164_14445 [Phycisphaera sp.]|nr:hypothetical protein [Phycisphaera sp.]
MKPPLIQSPRTRGVVLTVIMAVLFALSLGVTVLLTRSVRVGGLSVDLPREWQTVSAGPVHGSDLVENSTVLRSSDGRSKMWIDELYPVAPTSPAALFKPMMAEKLGDEPQHAVMRINTTPLRVGQLVGQQLAYVSVKGNDASTSHTWVMALLTLDGCRYWAITVMGGNPTDDGGQTAAMAEHLLANLGQGLAIDRYEDATTDQSLSVGLAHALPGDARLVKDESDPKGTLRVIRTDGPPTVCAMRIRREACVGLDDTKDPLSARTLLSSLYINLFNHAPPDDAIVRASFGSHTLWRMSYPIPNQPWSRQLWYLGDDGAEDGVLIDFCFDAQDAQASLEWGQRILDRVTPPSLGNKLSPTLIEVGQKIADAQRSSLLQPLADTIYSWIESNNQPVGWVRELSAAVGNDGHTSGTPAVEGRTGVHLLSRDGLQHTLDTQWRVSTSSDPFAMEFNHFIQSPAGMVREPTRRMVLHEGTIQMSRETQVRDESGQTVRQYPLEWSMPEPAALLLPGNEDRWPIEPIKDATGPIDALAWVFIGNAPPMPSRIEAQRADDNNTKSTYRVAIRPLLTFEYDVRLLDDNGHAQLRGEWDRLNGRKFLIHPATSRQIVAMMPWSADEIQHDPQTQGNTDDEPSP